MRKHVSLAVVTVAALLCLTDPPPAGPPGGLGYRLISGPDAAEFCRRVSEWISKGYVLYGNPTMVVGDGIVTVGQALVWPTSARS